MALVAVRRTAASPGRGSPFYSLGVKDNMRYYHYISSAKVDMLFPQIPQSFLAGLKVELGFDFGLLKGSLSGETPPPQSLIARTQAIERYLTQEGKLAAAPVEHEWFRRRMRLRAGYLPECPGLILFGGTEDSSTLLLAGSEAHVLSGSVNPGKDQGWSFMPRLLAGLQDYVSENFDVLDLETDGPATPSVVAHHLIFGGSQGSGYAMQQVLVDLPRDSLPAPELELEFLCRVFHVTDTGEGRLILASPVYVADAA